MDNFAYLFAAFAVIWVAVFIYVLIVSSKVNTLKREIDKLKTLLKPAGK